MLFMFKKIHVMATIAAVAIITASGNAFAGQPKPWQMGLQEAASTVMERITEFHNLLFIIITGIVLFVMALLIYVIIRFNEKANPVPSTRSHNTMLEIVWTAVPIMILVAIATPSIKLLYFMDKNPDAEMTLKITGNQWYWSYEYPNNGGFEFDSYIVDEDDLKEGQPRLLTVDNEVVLPVDTDIRLLVTASDVIHSWAVPAFGIKIDTVPGRTNETWVRITKEGSYTGQCSELCGVNHAFMPIFVKAVSKEAFKAWTVEARKEFAKADDNPLRIALVNDEKATAAAR